MKATGIIRKIDELGRIVLPKDIRRSLNLKVGTALEIFVDEDSLILKEYSQLKNLKEKAEDIADCLNKTLECDVVITDLCKVILSNGKNVKNIQNNSITPVLSTIIDERKTVIHNKMNNQIKNLIANITLDVNSIIVCPIFVNGDALGSIICLNLNKEFSPADAKCVNALNCLLCKQCEL